MKTLKELLLLQVLRENKNHLIKNLNISEDKKQKLIAFFEKHPNLENKVDWNKKNLTWDDLKKAINFREEKMKKAEKSLKQMSDFKENIDYVIHKGSSKMGMIQPLTYEFQIWLQLNNKFGPPAKWCLGWESDPSYWDDYALGSDDKERSYFVCFWDTKRKIMAQIERATSEVTFWNEQDKELGYEELEPYLKERIDISDLENINFYEPHDSSYDIPNYLEENADYYKNQTTPISFIPLNYEFIEWFADRNKYGWEVDWNITNNPELWNIAIRNNIYYMVFAEHKNSSKKLVEINHNDEQIYVIEDKKVAYQNAELEENIKKVLDSTYLDCKKNNWENDIDLQFCEL